jgi:hypothetical protein
VAPPLAGLAVLGTRFPDAEPAIVTLVAPIVSRAVAVALAQGGGKSRIFPCGCRTVVGRGLSLLLLLLLLSLSLSLSLATLWHALIGRFLSRCDGHACDSALAPLHSSLRKE